MRVFHSVVILEKDLAKGVDLYERYVAGPGFKPMTPGLITNSSHSLLRY